MENPPSHAPASSEPAPVPGARSAAKRSKQSQRGPAVSMLLGGLAFSVVSVLAYSLWAFPPGFIKGELALYSSIALTYLLLAGLFLHRLVPGERKIVRFYAAFVPGFLAYSILWTICYFSLRGTLGETVGSALGLAALTAIMLAVLQRRFCWFWECLGILFLLHTLGYTLGGLCYYSTYESGTSFGAESRLLAPLLEGHQQFGRLLWGFFHGFGFGAGLGYLFTRPRRISTDTA